MTLIKLLIALILPPAAAAMQIGFSSHFWVNIVLSLIGWLPGVVHAWWLILADKHPNPMDPLNV